ncbi:hypothetical protein Lal_00048572 [Lupinus albus]|nr:hypothetical protein Lal_00048572 [Lupinus albus]
MPRHLLVTRMNGYEIPTVPVYYPAKPQPRERAWRISGKETLLSLTLDKWELETAEVITTTLTLFYLFVNRRRGAAPVFGPRPASVVDRRAEDIVSTNTNRESVAYRSFSPSEFEARGVRKVTTGITGLWQPSVHSDRAMRVPVAVCRPAVGGLGPPEARAVGDPRGVDDPRGTP